jgi:hypothetical protein
MSTVIAKNVQIGTSGTATDNFTIFQPATPDGTLRIGNGNTGITTSQVALTSAGNVGIGTSSPASKFHTAGTGTTAITVSNASAGTTGSPQLTQVNFLGYNNESRARVEAIDIAGSANGSQLRFYTANTSNVLTQQATIDSSGNLLVGTTSALDGGGYKLQIRHDGARAIVTETTGTSISYAAVFRNGNGTVGNINTNGTATSYATSSDYRLKNTIAPMTGALAKVAALKPCTYKWNVDGSDGQGFIAHELAEVVPDAVVGEKDAVDAEGNPQYQGIDTSFLVATLTAALQEAHGLIKDLQARVNALEAK